ncbi:hypothetical protein Zm00014a_043983 [Zea mays]|uniref:Uncharacterized protein n=1 Tax=Zea mays TaxID=4577 RepID=A0A3L6F1S0_MAIZE|nr:hypothetical protein Zm00014a_043983 [Zea mays]
MNFPPLQSPPIPLSPKPGCPYITHAGPIVQTEFGFFKNSTNNIVHRLSQPARKDLHLTFNSKLML